MRNAIVMGGIGGVGKGSATLRTCRTFFTSVKVFHNFLFERSKTKGVSVGTITDVDPGIFSRIMLLTFLHLHS